jgi:hypothetical protein
MKQIFLLLPIFASAQYVSMDSLVAKAFRQNYIECEFMKKDLFDTRTLVDKQTEITTHLKRIIDLQNKESVLFANSLEVVKGENETMKDILRQKDRELLVERRKKKANKHLYFGLGVLGGFISYNIIK